MWIEPVTDRTSEDVEYARQNRNDAEHHKGAQNYTDWNRLAYNMYHLASALRRYGYAVPLRSKANWKIGDIPNHQDIHQFRIDLQMLRKVILGLNTYLVAEFDSLGLSCSELDDRHRVADEYYSKRPLPNLPYTHFEKINEIESVSLNIKQIIEQLKQAYKVAGTFNSGQATYLPHFIEPEDCAMTALEFDLLERTAADISAERRTTKEFYNKCYDPFANLTCAEFDSLQRTASDIDAEGRAAEYYYRRM